MVATMEQELKASRNVIGMLERFKGECGTSADWRVRYSSGGYAFLQL